MAEVKSDKTLNKNSNYGDEVDYVAYGSLSVCGLNDIARFPIGNDSYECIVTNLPRKDFAIFPAVSLMLLMLT